MPNLRHEYELENPCIIHEMCCVACVGCLVCLCGRCERHVSILVEEQVTIALSGT